MQRGDLAGRVAGDAGRDAVGLQHGDACARALEQAAVEQAQDPAADDADVDVERGASSGGYVVCGAVSIQTDVGRPGSAWVMAGAYPGRRVHEHSPDGARRASAGRSRPRRCGRRSRARC